LAGLLVTSTVAFVLIAVKLADIQGLSAARYAAMGISQRLRSVVLPAARGTIFDRNGQELALSLDQPTIWANPHLVADPRQEAQALSPLLGLPVPDLEDRLTRAAGFVYLARKVDPALAARVKTLNLPGIFFLNEPRRFLPSGPLALSLIGEVGTDNNGLSGLELQYDRRLAGKPGKLLVEEDPRGGEIPGGLHRYQASTPGDDLVLTLDQSLQFETEQALAAQVQASGAHGGMAIVMQSGTGDILAMANLVATPSSSNPVQQAPSASALTNVYEPGSVNKLMTVSAALQEGVIKPSDHLSVPDVIGVAGNAFHDAESHPTSEWSITDIVTNSSNVGAIEIGEALGKDRLNKYLRAYGFGARTDLDFPGESAGLLLDPANWYSTSIATVPIGQGVAVTAMQMISAYNAIANGGMYVAPKLVEATVDGHGRQHATPPSPEHRVVSPETAREMTVMLDEVVRVGTGTKAGISGYTVAGKTGTARKPQGGTYLPGAYVSSFAGFVPAQHPAFTAMVVLDQPSPAFMYGGDVAAPVFAKISKYALRELRIPPPPGGPPSDPAVPLATPAGALNIGDIGGPGTIVAGPAVAPPTSAPARAPRPAARATAPVVPPVKPTTTTTTTPAHPPTTTPPPTTTTVPRKSPPGTSPPPSGPPTTRPPQH
jgi:cell division protein FtsI (penicillin-binding protein 3)